MAMLQMVVGVMDARLDPFGSADSGLAGVRDDVSDGGEATAVLAAGLPFREDGDYSDEIYDDLTGVGGSSRSAPFAICHCLQEHIACDAWILS